MARIFMSYRRTDSAAISGRIYDRLARRFRTKNIFKDVDNIPPGVNFAAYIQESLRQCTVALVIIGPHWLEAATSAGTQRLDDPSDFMRLEIETAFQLGLRVLPVLVEEATMPAPEQLPESLRELALVNAVEVRNDPDFVRDMERLVRALERALAQPRRLMHLPRAPTHAKQPSAAQPSAVPPAVVDVATSATSAQSALSAPPLNATRKLDEAHGMKRAPGVGRTIRRRNSVLATLAAILVVGSLAVVLATRSPSSAYSTQAQETQTARTTTARTASALNTQNAQAEATVQQENADATQTHISLLVHFPYSTAAPGPGCDNGYAPWTVGYDGTQSVQCFADHTHMGADGVQWVVSTDNPFPQSYTVRVQVSNWSPSAGPLLKVYFQDGSEVFVGLESSGSSGEADYCPPQGSCTGVNTNVNPAAIHTLSMSVNGTHVTFAIDGNTFHSADSSAPETASVHLQLAYTDKQTASADFSNFSIG
jgi:hypothetical protein